MSVPPCAHSHDSRMGARVQWLAAFWAFFSYFSWYIIQDLPRGLICDVPFRHLTILSFQWQCLSFSLRIATQGLEPITSQACGFSFLPIQASPQSLFSQFLVAEFKHRQIALRHTWGMLWPFISIVFTFPLLETRSLHFKTDLLILFSKGEVEREGFKSIFLHREELGRGRVCALMNKEENENEGLDKLKVIKIIQGKWSKRERTCGALGSQKCTSTWLSLYQSNVPGLSPVDRHSVKLRF